MTKHKVFDIQGKKFESVDSVIILIYFQIINPADLLKTHITGVIDHGRNHFLTFVDVGQFPHDPNLTINIILRALKKHSDASVSINSRFYHSNM